eukprot:CAMPEP_0114323610 /NCGR_PEP_ID=MMETSP0059-20121206/27987_1 /TAXON_ID=36894 /ORGANISM="Pyramimonas parkeae, Strain CCMP726" /LENGTH=175 /DNA_ID=CAMNT_0001451937 /DNA_START=102 /DNA_END=629 /DNA_ORIENTATION=-
MCGIAAGAWIVSFDWVRDSVRAGGWVHELAYELRDCMQRHGPRLGRLRRVEQTNPVFHGCTFFFAGAHWERHPDRTAICELVNLGGGTVLSQPPPSVHVVNDSMMDSESCSYVQPLDVHHHTWIVTTTQLSQNEGKHIIQEWGKPPVLLNWLFDSITAYQLQDTAPYEWDASICQ